MVDAKQLVVDLQALRDSGHLSDALLRYAVRNIKKADPRFDWVGVYLLNTDKNELWLHNYLGSPTEHAQIPVGTGVCGTAVEQKQNLRVDDVSTVENYLACSPKVKAEMVVLIRAGDQILGQIDIDSNTKEAFTEDDETAVQAVADKLAEVIMHERSSN